jgi:hypothetical protein
MAYGLWPMVYGLWSMVYGISTLLSPGLRRDCQREDEVREISQWPGEILPEGMLKEDLYGTRARFPLKSGSIGLSPKRKLLKCSEESCWPRY